MPNLLKFFCFFLLFAVMAGRGDTIITEPRGNLLLFHHIAKTDSVYYDSKNIPLAAAKEAFEKDSGVFTDFKYGFDDPFGVMIKSIPQTKEIIKIGRRLETNFSPNQKPTTKKFNPYFIIALIALIFFSFLIGKISSLN
jgi:hypothetical protein